MIGNENNIEDIHLTEIFRLQDEVHSLIEENRSLIEESRN